MQRKIITGEKKLIVWNFNLEGNSGDSSSTIKIIMDDKIIHQVLERFNVSSSKALCDFCLDLFDMNISCQNFEEASCGYVEEPKYFLKNLIK